MTERFDRIWITANDWLTFYRKECDIMLWHKRVTIKKPVTTLLEGDFKFVNQIESNIRKLKLLHYNNSDVIQKLKNIDKEVLELKELLVKDIWEQFLEYKREQIEILYNK